jgi:hypothetical protein
MFSVMLPDTLAKSAYSEKTIAAFLSMYNPTGTIQVENTDAREFVNLLPLLSTRDEALQTAVLAIGITQLGTTVGNQDLIRQGRTLYGKALKETAVALRSPARANSESLLVVPRIMGLFDMLYSADPGSYRQAISWLSHSEGELAMILSRGPEAFWKDDAAHSLFTNARYRLFAPALRGRKPTILNNEDWKTLPWKGRTKTSDDILIDIFCEIPELLESTDKLTFMPMSEQEREGLQVQTLAQCWTLHFQLQAWVDAEANAIYTPEFGDSTSRITFPNIDIACRTLRYWLLGIFLYSALDILSGIDPTTDGAHSHPDRPHPRRFARNIVRSVDYFFQEEFGITGFTAIWSPLGNALFYMSRNRPADIQYITMIMQSWNHPNLPGTMREFLVSFRRTVAMGTLVPIPMSELQKGSTLPLRMEGFDTELGYWSWEMDKQVRELGMTYRRLNTTS